MKACLGSLLGAVLLLGSGAVSARPGDRIDRYPIRVCQECTSSDQLPVVAADARGNFVVVWVKYGGDPEIDGVWARRFAADGTPRGGEFRVSPQGTTADDQAAVAMAPDGRFVVTWHQRFRPDGEAIVARRFAASGSALSGVLTVSPPARSSVAPGHPDVAMDAAGNFVVVWATPIPTKNLLRAYGRSYDAYGQPRGAEFVVFAGTEGSSLYPDVAMGDQGQFVAVWLQLFVNDASRNAIRGKRFDLAGNVLGVPFNVASTNSRGFLAGDMELAAAPSGAFAVIYPRWRETVNGSAATGVFVQRFTAQGVARGDPQRASDSGVVPFANEVGVDVDDDGDFVVVWIEQPTDGATPQLHVRLYAESGHALTRDRAFSFDDTGARNSTVAMDANGDFVVAFDGSGRDAYGNWVASPFAQRFAGPDDRRPGCASFIAGIVGTSGNDTIHGTAGDDVIVAFAGDDLVYGHAGNDVLCGQAGNDQLFGEAGDDFLSGGYGDDVLDGGNEHDVCLGNADVNADTAIQCEQVGTVP